MGVLYFVFPFNEEVQSWLQKENISIPNGVNFGRNPTVKEIKAVLEDLTEYEIELNQPKTCGTWQAFVQRKTNLENEWTLLNMIDFVDEDTPSSIHFEKGWIQLIAKIVSGLSKECGTFLLLPDTGDQPLIITPEIEINLVVAKWLEDCRK